MTAIILPMLLLAAGCSQDEPTKVDKAVAALVPGAPPGGSEAALANGAPASDIREKNDLIEFAYAYPAEAAQIPELARFLDADRQVKHSALVAAAERDRAASAKGGFPYHAHSHLQKWLLVTNTPRFLSLSAEIGTYAGGAHGMTSFDTLLWDRNKGARLKPVDLFSSPEAFDAAIREDFCDRIKQAKAAKGIQTADEPGSPFAECPPVSAQTVWVGSSDGRYLDRMTIAIAPYEIGPFAEGSYKINMPITSALVRVVKPEFARDFLPVN
ncbi:hypothetical protein GCM10009115_20630 [Sphingopyxis soli]|uniref:Deacetylase PdaC domain-containing protein n=1 Tax=Sphingopyxis soli TaxID=592051 RepID=A0ABN1M6E1_9SPHN|nr:DUF4163 domain-containing protein [Sphingopyxis soli]